MYSNSKFKKTSVTAMCYHYLWYFYMVGHKKTCHSILVHNFWEMLADFKNLFTVGLSSKFATKLMSYFPPHLKCVTTLPCEIQKINSSNSLNVFNAI